MKKALKDKVFLVILCLLVLAGCGTKDEHAHQEGTRYTCPMHPQIVTEEPGICPICKMDLVPLSHQGEVNADDSLKYLVKPTNELVISSVATVKPQSGKRFGQDSIRGVINYNTNNFNSISSRISGRIERLYVNYNYQLISKGQKIMDVYSPDLANAQQELLFLQQNNEPALMESAKRKLRLLGMGDQQINSILKTGKISNRTTIYSPYSGYLSEGTNGNPAGSGSALPGGTMISETGSDDNMGGAAASPSPTSIPLINSNTSLSISEGQYITAGQKLFDLINASSVWAEFYLRPEQLQTIKRGTVLRVTSADNSSQNAEVKVNLIQPYFNEGINFTVARARLSNPERNWRVGQLINVSTLSGGVKGTWIPRKAVLQLGSKQVLFIKEEGGFKPMYINVLNTLGDWMDIGNQIPANTGIAANAWFLVDSESFIKPDSIKP